jgi:hypothetical protein
MAKMKSKAIVMTADGAGGMTKLEDRRFERPGDWPITFQLPGDQADTWFKYFFSECETREWSSATFGQMEARENSGSITVSDRQANQPRLAVVWERKRNGPMVVRARPLGAPEFALSDAQQMLCRINERFRSGAKELFFCHGQITYQDGLPWRGELWLDNTLRLSPPSRQDETALIGPRVVIVDALVEGVSRSDSSAAFGKQLEELSAFLSLVTGWGFQIAQPARAWTFKEGPLDCDVRQLGYIEQEIPKEMPGQGTCRSMPLRPISRPNFSPRGIFPDDTELRLPADVMELWAAYSGLTEDKRRQFLQAAAKWQEALTQVGNRSTLRFALMVVACEALKPDGPAFRDCNIYHVVKALLGGPVAERLREDWFRPQDVRNAHLHLGQFRGSEFVERAITSSYYDPTFDQARFALALIVQETMVEWLRRRGTFTVPIVIPKVTLRRWVRDHTFALLPILTMSGIVFGWLIRMLWAH